MADLAFMMPQRSGCGDAAWPDWPPEEGSARGRGACGADGMASRSIPSASGEYAPFLDCAASGSLSGVMCADVPAQPFKLRLTDLRCVVHEATMIGWMVPPAVSPDARQLALVVIGGNSLILEPGAMARRFYFALFIALFMQRLCSPHRGAGHAPRTRIAFTITRINLLTS